MIMIFALLFIFTLLLSSIRQNNNQILFSKETTATINGVFVIIVFISHFNTYINDTSLFGSISLKTTILIGQLMVVPFLLFSGYGIMSSIIAEGRLNINKMIRRLLSVWIPFVIAIAIYSILYVYNGNLLSFGLLIKSIIAWETIGNSSWFMFSTFIVYIISILSMLISRNNIKSFLTNVFVFTLLFFLIMRGFKESYWYNTILCFPLGMFIKYNEKSLINAGKTSFFIKLIAIFALISILRFIAPPSSILYVVYTFLFSFLITLFCCKYSFNNRILKFISKHTFGIYIYQRLVFELFLSFNTHITVYFLLSLLSTICIAILLDKFSKHILMKVL